MDYRKQDESDSSPEKHATFSGEDKKNK